MEAPRLTVLSGEKLEPEKTEQSPKTHLQPQHQDMAANHRAELFTDACFLYRVHPEGRPALWGELCNPGFPLRTSAPQDRSLQS